MQFTGVIPVLDFGDLPAEKIVVCDHCQKRAQGERAKKPQLHSCTRMYSALSEYKALRCKFLIVDIVVRTKKIGH